MKKLLLTLGLLLAFANLTHAQVPLASEDVMLQGFYWNSHNETKWNQLKSQASEIGTYFTLIWLPPASKGEMGGDANMGYHPDQYSNLNSAWGNKDDLIKLIKALNKAGCKAIADVIINHKAGGSYGTICKSFPTEYFGKFGNFKMPSTFICKDDEVSCSPKSDNYDTGEKYPAARDLDHKNPQFQKMVEAYLKWLTQEIGYSGFRYDMTKGYAPQYNKQYNTAVKPYFSVGEYWEGDLGKLSSWVYGAGKQSLTFDFAMKYAINEWGGGSNYSKLSWSGKPAGMVSRDDLRQYAVTFIDNHDTATPHENPQEYGGDWQKANAFLLSAPGIPCVFWKHWNNASCKAAIKKMITARRAVGINSNSYVKVTNTNGYYECEAEGRKGKLICRIGNFPQNVPAGYKKACSGNGWAYYATIDMPPTPPSPTPGPGPQPIPEEGVFVQFKKPANWEKVFVYTWNGDGAQATTYSGEWPGTELKPENGLYKWSKKDIQSTMIIFGNGTNMNEGGQQTVDLSAYGKICFDGTNSTEQLPKPEGEKNARIIPGDCQYVGVEEVEAKDFIIYPNPTTGLATIVSDDEVSYVIVRNLAGRTVGSSITNEVDMSGLAPSMYLVEVLFEDGTSAVRKVIRK